MLGLLTGLAAAAGDLGGLAAGSLLVAVVALFLGYGHLQRAWSDPLVAGDPQVATIKRLAGVAGLGWGLALLVRLVALLLPGDADRMRWVADPLVVVGLVSYLAVLVLVARWRPGPV